MKKLFVTRKYIWARTAKEAIKLDSKTPVDDCWIDEDWKKNSGGANAKDAVGFYVPNEYND